MNGHVVSLAMNTEGRAPDWVQLIPPGIAIKGIDGRPWTMRNPAAVIKAFKALGMDLPVDYEHQDDDPARRVTNGPVPAAGWIKDLRHDAAQGLMARVEWTATARRLIEEREYRYLSPTFTYDRAGAIARILGASLVHRPNLHLKALAREETKPMNTPTDTAQTASLAKIATALGLDAGADEGATLVAIQRTKPRWTARDLFPSKPCAT